MKKKKRKRGWLKKFLFLLIIAAAAAGVYYWYQKDEKKEEPLAANAKVEEVTRGTIRIMTEGNGQIEAAETVTVTAPYTLKIEEVKVENGDVVEAGDVIAAVDRESVREQIEILESSLSEMNSTISNMDRSGSSALSAPVSGRVKRIYAEQGDVLTDVVAAHGGVMELSADGKMKVEISATDDLKTGATVNVSFLDYEEEGTVISEEDGIYTITLEDGENYDADLEAVVTDENGRTLGTGTLQPNHAYLVECAYGIADEIHVDEGEYVNAGTTLLTRTNVQYHGAYLTMLEKRSEVMEKLRELRALEREPRLKAEKKGILSGLSLADCTVAAQDAPMYQLILTDSFWLKAEIDELDIAGVEEGQNATIVFDAFDTEEYEGRVEKISALGQNVNGVTKYTVTVSVPGIDKVKTAMSATVTIVTDEKADVLLIPIDAVQTVNGQKCVTVLRGESQEIVPVTLGLVNHTQAEVAEGLQEGDQVVVQGKSDFEVMMDMMQQSRSHIQGGDN